MNSDDVADAWLELVHGSACVACARPGRVLCARCEAGLAGLVKPGGTPVRPHPCPPGLAPALAAGEYADPLRRLIVAHKERQVLSLARPLGDLLAVVVASLLTVPSAGAPLEATRTLMVPMPSRPRAVRERGHDPMLRIVRVAARLLRRGGFDVEVAPLLRHRLRVADQAGLDAAQRRANLSDGLVVRPHGRTALVRAGVPVRTVVCDDVVTTGSSAREAQRALEEAGVPVLGIAALAATPRRRLR